MKKQAFNPYMPSWEYVPDGEPHVFGDRAYVYGSHDLFNGWAFCLGDYICYSAPVDNLSDWRYEGVIYPKISDPANTDGKMNLYAPDVTQGPDGRYYLYYVLDMMDIVSVAVCDTPAGKYEFLGYVHYPEGTPFGRNEKMGDEWPFDPAVLTEGARVYLYTGSGSPKHPDHHGAMVVELDRDMLTVLTKPKFIVPNKFHSAGTEYEGHAFFEASSIRKFGDTYYFLYSSELCHELCYATSDKPTEGFRYQGVAISNCDMGLDTYKPADMKMTRGGNNHGGFVKIGDDYYVFYHRHTNGTPYSRQACAAPITMNEDGTFRQAEISSCGLNGGPLVGKGYYPAYIACYTFGTSVLPKVTQDGRDGDQEPGYVAGLLDKGTAGFREFDFDGTVKEIKIRIRGYADGVFEVRTKWDGEVLAEIPVSRANIWLDFSAPITLPTGVQSLFFTYRGTGSVSLGGFELI